MIDDTAATPPPASGPAQPSNPPGLSTIRYRIGDFNSFRRMMLAMVADADLLSAFPDSDRHQLNNPFVHWRPGIHGDYQTMLIELWAYLGDILTFYQERIANEAYLQTATQRDSLLRLTQIVNYQPLPSTGARSLVAFTVDPNKAVVVPSSLRLGNKPPPNAPAAVFETHAPIAAVGAHNAIPMPVQAPATQFAPLSDYAVLAGNFVMTAALLTMAPVHISAAATRVFDAAGAQYARTFAIDPLVFETTIASTPMLAKTGQSASGPYFQVIRDASQIGQPSAVQQIGSGSIAMVGGIEWFQPDQITRSVVLDGTTTRLKVGDYVLVVEKEGDPSERATPYQLTAVVADTAARTTTISWIEDAAMSYQPDTSLYALRVKAAPFGNNAPNWQGLPPALRGTTLDANRQAVSGPYIDENWDDPIDLLNPWPYVPFPGDPSNLLFLDAVYDAIKATPGSPSWAVLLTYAQLWRLTTWESIATTGAPNPYQAWPGHFTPTEVDQLLVQSGTTWHLGSISGGTLTWQSIAPGNQPNMYLVRAWVGRFTGTQEAQLLVQARAGWYLGSIANGTFTWQALTLSPDQASPELAWVGRFTPSGVDQLLGTFGTAWRLGSIEGTTLTWQDVTTASTDISPIADQAWAGALRAAGQSQLLLYTDDTWYLGSVSLDGSTLTLTFATPAGNSSDSGGESGDLSWNGDFTRTDTNRNPQPNAAWTGDFTGSGRDDILFYFAWSTNWWRGTFVDDRLTWTRVSNTQGPGIPSSSQGWAGHFSDPHQTQLLIPPPQPAAFYTTGAAATTLASAAWSLGAFTTNEGHRVVHVTQAEPISKAGYVLSAKVTRLTLGAGETVLGDNDTRIFPLRHTIVLAGAEKLQLKPTLPLPQAVSGEVLVLQGAYGALANGQTVIVRGRTHDPMAAEPSAVLSAEVHTLPQQAQLDPATNLTIVSIENPLTHRYVRADTVLMANVAEVSQGETIADEVLGSGDGSPFQAYPLRRKPLAYLPAVGPDGQQTAVSTLVVSVNEMVWNEQQSLHRSAASAHDYVTKVDDAGGTTVMFGDGVNGARPPSGVDNIRAQYRVGAGSAGNLPPDTIVQLIDSVPGLQGVTNPLTTSGGSDMPPADDLRAAALLDQKRSGPAVSPADYAALALTFPGVGKARARQIQRTPDGRILPRPILQLIVATTDNKPLAAHAGLTQELQLFLQKKRDPNIRLQIVDCNRVNIEVAATIDVSESSPQGATLSAARAALSGGVNPDGTLGYFAYERVQLGQAIPVAALQSVLQSVQGVKSARITILRRVNPRPDPPHTVQDLTLEPDELPVLSSDLSTAISLGSGGFAGS